MARLPPLPRGHRYLPYFPARLLPLSPDPIIRKAPGRILIADPGVADHFTRALGIRPGEVIVEGYAALGGLTRSLVSGGNAVGEGKAWEENDERVGKSGKVSELKVKPANAGFLDWIPDLPAVSHLQPQEPLPKIKPNVVVATEGSVELLVRGMDYPLSQKSRAGPPADMLDYPKLVKSPHADNLILSHSTIYTWRCIPSILSNPAVSASLPVWDREAAPEDQTKRPWDAPPPPITVVATVPDSQFGEQLLMQWVRSAAGDAGRAKSWIWEWGRCRLALLVGKNHYDKLMARPGDRGSNKLSVMASGLFHILPLPPYHHVHNIRRGNNSLKSSPKSLALVPKSSVPPIGMGPPCPGPDPESLPRMPDAGETTVCYPNDFFPCPTTPHNLGSPLPRPDLLGVLLIPKLHSPFTASRKDVWDYVLRRLYVRETITIREALPNLSFGAESLMPIIEKEWKEGEEGARQGVPVSGRRKVKDLDFEEWIRVVDTFDNWVFKPEDLMTNVFNEETSRQIGTD